MRASAVRPTGVERTFGDEQIIVSKTDPRGVVTYVNDLFMEISAYPEHELIGRPHSVIRHPDMPRCVFKLLWERISGGSEMFAYIVNLAADGAHYWVLAHVTPTRDAAGRTVGYHSNRRTAAPQALERIEPLYGALLAEERRHDHPVTAIAASTTLLHAELDLLGADYDEFVWSLETRTETM
ncbi:MAG: PAS domain-containing protein [Microthrixaceae bacterium]